MSRPSWFVSNAETGLGQSFWAPTVPWICMTCGRFGVRPEAMTWAVRMSPLTVRVAEPVTFRPGYVDRAVELEDSDPTDDAHVRDTVEVAGRLEPAAKSGFDPAYVVLPAVRDQQLEVG